MNIANKYLSKCFQSFKCLLGEPVISLKHLNYTKIPV